MVGARVAPTWTQTSTAAVTGLSPLTGKVVTVIALLTDLSPPGTARLCPNTVVQGRLHVGTAGTQAGWTPPGDHTHSIATNQQGSGIKLCDSHTNDIFLTVLEGATGTRVPGSGEGDKVPTRQRGDVTTGRKGTLR
jgi:hypothetical protein